METTVNIPDDLLDMTMRFSSSKTKTDAIITAMKECICLKKLEQIMELEGTLKFSDDGEKARHDR
jgi:hypothetical protein